MHALQSITALSSPSPSSSSTSSKAFKSIIKGQKELSACKSAATRKSGLGTCFSRFFFLLPFVSLCILTSEGHFACGRLPGILQAGGYSSRPGLFCQLYKFTGCVDRLEGRFEIFCTISFQLDWGARGSASHACIHTHVRIHIVCFGWVGVWQRVRKNGMAWIGKRR